MYKSDIGFHFATETITVTVTLTVAVSSTPERRAAQTPNIHCKPLLEGDQVLAPLASNTLLALGLHLVYTWSTPHF